MKKSLDKADKKRTGSTYTPPHLATFTAKQIIRHLNTTSAINVTALDPAVGDGELLLALARELSHLGIHFSLWGFDTDKNAIDITRSRISSEFPNISLKLSNADFLDTVLTQNYGGKSQQRLPYDCSNELPQFDIVIANPPYVRTQVLGAEKSKQITAHFGLSGRVDLYHAFVPAIESVLSPNGLLGLIVSNRFISTRAGSFVRSKLQDNFHLYSLWDLGDTKLFDAAVLPAVLIARIRSASSHSLPPAAFTSVYECHTEIADHESPAILDALESGLVGRIRVGNSTYEVTTGTLKTTVTGTEAWRLSSRSSDRWLSTVSDHTYRNFGDIGKIRVGIKTTADNVFIRNDWRSLPPDIQPEKELLRPLITHREAAKWHPNDGAEQSLVLYTHQVRDGKRVPIDLPKYPRAAKYFEQNRKKLEGRKYVIESGRAWYEIWVPHNPEKWRERKLVFRDIAEQSHFFIDMTGSVINGDCYWITLDQRDEPDLLWLALAVGNSSFVTSFYDRVFMNKLYSNRRRYMTQYVEKFPLPDPSLPVGREIVHLTKEIYRLCVDGKRDGIAEEERLLNALVWRSFGLVEEIAR